jgi:orotidine-5'-phosphate decarboxylase
LLIAVTVLTSMGSEDLAELGIAIEPEQQVLRLARLTRVSGLDGVVCSPREAAVLRKEIGVDFTLVTPGIRPQGAALDDQTRVLTPAEAVRQGADYLVMGRPVTQADDPAAVLSAVNRELRES